MITFDFSSNFPIYLLIILIMVVLTIIIVDNVIPKR